MKKFIVFTLSLAMLFGAFAGCSDAKKPSAFSVGYAKADITPKDSVPLDGLGNADQRLSNGIILDPLFATCVACKDSEGNTVLMFGLDLLTTYGALFNDIRAKISNECNIPFENIMFFGSHTHSGPATALTQFPSVAAYNELVTNNCVQAAKDAIADLAPAKMQTAITRPEGLNFVRHYVFDNGHITGYRIYETEAIASKVGHPHKADNLMQLVKFVREGDDKKDVVLINWQAHYAGANDIDENAVSSDYIGVMRAKIEEELNCLVSFYQGGEGNISSGSRIVGEQAFSDYKDCGQKLADYAIEAADTFTDAEVGKIQVMSEEFVPDGRGNTETLYAIAFGDFACVFAPFEIYDTNAVNVRETSKYKFTFYAGLANTQYGNRYLPSEEGFSYPSYEHMSHNSPPNYKYSPYEPGSAEKVEAQLISMLDKMFAESGNTVKERPEGYITPEFVPVCDGVEYTNPTPGNLNGSLEGENGFYCLVLFAGNTAKKMLADSKETAELVLSQTGTMKLLFDERNVIVGVAE